MLIIVLIYLLIAAWYSAYCGILWFAKSSDADASDVSNINWWIAVILNGLLWPGAWVMFIVSMFTKNT